MFKPISKNSLYNEVINQLLEEIKKGRWKPGEKFPGEMELSNQFEISRNSIREAFKSLQHMGVIESFAGRGTFVTNDAIRKIQNTELVSLLSDSVGSYKELLEVRMAIETQSAYFAAQRRTEKDVEKLEETVRRLEKYMTNREDYAHEGFYFHMLIAKMAKNKYILKFFETISEDLMSEPSPHYQKKIDPDHSLSLHIKIYEGIKNKDPEAARDAMYEHFTHALSEIEE